jgi:hypothetical protein
MRLHAALQGQNIQSSHSSDKSDLTERGILERLMDRIERHLNDRF